MIYPKRKIILYSNFCMATSINGVKKKVFRNINRILQEIFSEDGCSTFPVHLYFFDILYFYVITNIRNNIFVGSIVWSTIDHLCPNENKLNHSKPKTKKFKTLTEFSQQTWKKARPARLRVAEIFEDCGRIYQIC